MKKEQVYRLIEPFVDAGIDLDIVQLSPFAIYNYISSEVAKIEDEDYDPNNPPESLVVLSMGTGNDRLGGHHGVRVWQRSVPLGGNHFHQAAHQGAELTFAKAEHLKRNARDAEDPRRCSRRCGPCSPTW